MADQQAIEALCGPFVEALYRKRAEEALERRVTELSALNSMAAIVNESVNVEEILNRAADEALRLVGVKAVVMFLLGEKTDELELMAHRGLSGKFVRAVSRLKLGQELAGRAAQTGQPMVIGHVAEYAGALKAFLEKMGIQSAASVPLVGSTGVIGVMGLAAASPQYFDAAGQELLVGLARQIATGVEKARLYEKKRDAAAVAAVAKSATDTIEAMRDGLILHTLDGKITSVNPAFERMSGHEKSELIGRDVADLMQELVKPEDLEKAMEGLGSALEGEVPLAASYTLVSKDGREVPISFTISFIRDAKGQPSTVIAAFTDITDLWRVEKERNRLFNLSIDMLCIAGFDGFFKQLNPAWSKTLGWAGKELMSIPWLEFVHPEDRRATVTAGAQLISGKPVISFENRYLCKDGSYRWISWNSFPLPEEELIFAVARDINGRKRAEEELRRLNEELRHHARQVEAANKELESFTYSVSHDLRAPLRAIDGFSRVLLEEHQQQLESEAQHYLQMVCKNTQQMSHLIDDLLSFSRLSSQPLKKQPVAHADLVCQALKDLRHEQEGRHVEISIGDLPVCQVDPALLKQVWVNLLSNALKFTLKRKVARIKIGCKDEGGKQVYFVKDNGVGFDMQYAHKLFGVFQRLHRTDEYEGTGVGLATAKRIIHRHGGLVWAEAKADRGATFFFTLEGGTSDE